MALPLFASKFWMNKEQGKKTDVVGIKAFIPKAQSYPAMHRKSRRSDLMPMEMESKSPSCEAGRRRDPGVPKRDSVIVDSTLGASKISQTNRTAKTLRDVIPKAPTPVSKRREENACGGGAIPKHSKSTKMSLPETCDPGKSKDDLDDEDSESHDLVLDFRCLLALKEEPKTAQQSAGKKHEIFYPKFQVKSQQGHMNSLVGQLAASNPKMQSTESHLLYAMRESHRIRGNSGPACQSCARERAEGADSQDIAHKKRMTAPACTSDGIRESCDLLPVRKAEMGIPLSSGWVGRPLHVFHAVKEWLFKSHVSPFVLLIFLGACAVIVYMIIRHDARHVPDANLWEF